MTQQIGSNKLFTFAIVLLCLALGYAYYIYFYNEEPIAPLTVQANSESLKNLKIDWTIISNKNYTALQQFGESPVNPGTTGGRQDIFSTL